MKEILRINTYVIVRYSSEYNPLTGFIKGYAMFINDSGTLGAPVMHYVVRLTNPLFDQVKGIDIENLIVNPESVETMERSD